MTATLERAATADLERVLRRIPGVYADLEDALIPGRSSEPPDSSPDPRNRPAPAKLNVADHRHKLVRGLRWWVDAVHPKDGRVPRVGQDVGLMCGMLERAAPTMEPEDQQTLRANLDGWLCKAWDFIGGPELAPAHLPPQALAQVVPQSVAARALGVPVSTIWRRAGGRGGPVRLGDVAGANREPAGTCR